MAVTSTETTDIKSLHQVCRLCLSKESLADLFKDSNLHQWITDFMSIKVWFAFFFSSRDLCLVSLINNIDTTLQISIEDRLSKAICAMCRQRLTEFHHFRERSLEVQGVLRSMLQNKDVSVENVMTDSKKNKDSNEHRCTLCGKSFLKR